MSMASAFGGEPVGSEALRVAVYDVPPYGYVSADGSIVGVSVDLWLQGVAEQLARPFVLTPVSDTWRRSSAAWSKAVST